MSEFLEEESEVPLLVIPVSIAECPFVSASALVDTGVNRNLIDTDFVSSLGVPLRLKKIPERPIMADPAALAPSLITHEVDLSLLVGEGFPLYISTFSVMPLGSAPILLGAPFDKSLKPIRDWENQRIIAPASIGSIVVHSLDSKPTLPPEFAEFADIFDEREADKLPPHRSFDHRIPLIDNQIPPSGPIYALSQNEQVVLRDYINTMLEKGFIQHSESPTSAPVLFVKKPDNSLRLLSLIHI